MIMSQSIHNVGGHRTVTGQDSSPAGKIEGKDQGRILKINNPNYQIRDMPIGSPMHYRYGSALRSPDSMRTPPHPPNNSRPKSSIPSMPPPLPSNPPPQTAVLNVFKRNTGELSSSPDLKKILDDVGVELANGKGFKSQLDAVNNEIITLPEPTSKFGLQKTVYDLKKSQLEFKQTILTTLHKNSDLRPAPDALNKFLNEQQTGRDIFSLTLVRRSLEDTYQHGGLGRQLDQMAADLNKKFDPELNEKMSSLGKEIKSVEEKLKSVEEKLKSPPTDEKKHTQLVCERDLLRLVQGFSSKVTPDSNSVDQKTKDEANNIIIRYNSVTPQRSQNQLNNEFSKAREVIGYRQYPMLNQCLADFQRRDESLDERIELLQRKQLKGGLDADDKIKLELYLFAKQLEEKGLSKEEVAQLASRWESELNSASVDSKPMSRAQCDEDFERANVLYSCCPDKSFLQSICKSVRDQCLQSVTLSKQKAGFDGILKNPSLSLQSKAEAKIRLQMFALAQSLTPSEIEKGKKPTSQEHRNISAQLIKMQQEYDIALLPSPPPLPPSVAGELPLPPLPPLPLPPSPTHRAPLRPSGMTTGTPSPKLNNPGSPPPLPPLPPLPPSVAGELPLPPLPSPPLSGMTTGGRTDAEAMRAAPAGTSTRDDLVKYCTEHFNTKEGKDVLHKEISTLIHESNIVGQYRRDVWNAFGHKRIDALVDFMLKFKPPL
jgi:hypothetical protein